MPEHPNSATTTQPCCTQTAIESLSAIIRLSSEYEAQRVTESVIQEKLVTAMIVAESLGHVTDDVDSQFVLGSVETMFTIFTPEAQRLIGDEAGHVPWLFAKRSDVFTVHGFWDNYRKLLANRIPDSARNRLDEITDDVLDNLEDPARGGQWDRRGLVMGHVQSGKTANYVGLMCKAADAGYKVIVVLAGTHNNLRTQTQFRVDEGFTGRDTRDDAGVKSDKLVGVGLESERGSVFSLTSARDDGDFRATVASAVGVDFGMISHPTVFVVKKNAHILSNLFEWLRDNAPMPPGHERIAGIPVLVIDDEADHASVNTANYINDPDVEPTRINREIRRLLNLFDESAYVGYTATPFANIFIEDQEADDDYGPDLFPRHFIFSLQAPENYVGPEMVFGLPESGGQRADDDTDDVAPLPFISYVRDYRDWIPDSHRKDLVIDPHTFPPSLQRAIDSFVLSSAARALRGQHQQHHSMLVHVTRFVMTQQHVRDQVSDYLLTLRNDLLYNTTPAHGKMADLEEIWYTDFAPLTRSLRSRGAGEYPVRTFGDVSEHIVAAVSKIQVRMINGSSTDVLDYHRHSRDGLSTIVIGGAKLSRGLTLEGLSVSYYLRASQMYDTLMQMGRWFGYRPGYLDLCRIYTTPLIADSYRSIALATNELLDDFEEMHNEGGTPADFGLKVRHSPGLLVTSRAKMRSGTKLRVSFGQSRPESTTFAIDLDSRTKAFHAVEELVRDLGPPTIPQRGSNWHWKNVGHDDVVAYFRVLQAADLYNRSGSGIPRYIADYVEQRADAGGLVNWTVLLKSVQSPERDNGFPVAGLHVGLAQRQHRGSPTLGRYVIKSLIGSQDEAFDLTDAQIAEAGERPYGIHLRKKRPPENGLLILYMLDVPTREAIAAIEPGPPFAAYCVSFPNDPTGTAVEYIVNNVYDSQE